jgi:hypothetical protein
MPCFGQWAVQSVPLQQGWNAVYLQVQPFPADCAAQFAGLPIVSIQRHNLSAGTAQFDTDPADLFLSNDEWLSWRPDDGRSGYVNTLRNVIGDAAYLIQATSNCTWTVTGRPVLPRMNWVAGKFNMAGFQVSQDATQPTFADFFRYEPDIDSTASYTEERIFGISATLAHQNLTPRTAQQKIAPGVAYWIKAQGASSYAGALHLRTASPDGLDFGSRDSELELTVRNDYGAPITLTARHVASASPPSNYPPIADATPLQIMDGATNRQWCGWELGVSRTYSLRIGETLTLQLAVDRTRMAPPNPAGAYWQSLLEIGSSCGSLVRVPVSARYGTTSEEFSVWPCGLWVGEAKLRSVSQVSLNPTNGVETATPPQPASDEFPLRLILHAGADGAVRLLSRAIVTAETLADSNVVNRLYTDEARVPAGAALVTRVSSPAFGLIAPVTLTGAGFGQSLGGSFTVGYDDPVHPFKHVYHPDHDNRKADGVTLLPDGVECCSISNTVSLTWSAPAGLGGSAMLWDPRETTTGTYSQAIGNLRRVPLTVEGAFNLQRVSRVGRLEP